ncbi:MAG: response regulator [Acidobacteriota bacterium]
MHIWEHNPRRRPGRLEQACSAPLADQRRILLVGTDDDWRLLTAYLFEDAGYTAYAAADGPLAVTLVARLLPDVVVVQMDAPAGLDVLMRLRDDARAANTPVVVLTAWIQSVHAQRVRALGGVPLAPDAADIKALVADVTTLIVDAARGPRALKRRLLDLQELARYYRPDAEGKAQLRRLIDQLQVAIFAVDEQGHCIAASEGLTTLTGYSRLQLLSRSIGEIGFVPGHVSALRWRGYLASRQSAGMASITTQAGEDIAVHTATVAEIFPGFHVAAFAAADPQRRSDAAGHQKP